MTSNNLRSRNFSFVIWNEDPHYIEQMEIVNRENSAWIVHDKDIDEQTGEKKKVHTHVVVSFNDAKTCLSVAKYFHLFDKDGKPVEGRVTLLNKDRRHNKDGALKYLCHAENSDKYLYPVEDIGGRMAPLACKLISQVNKVDNEQKVQMLIEYIFSSHSYISWTQLTNYAVKNNIASSLFSKTVAFSKLLEEHNFPYRKK